MGEVDMPQWLCSHDRAYTRCKHRPTRPSQSRRAHAARLALAHFRLLLLPRLQPPRPLPLPGQASQAAHHASRAAHHAAQAYTGAWPLCKGLGTARVLEAWCAAAGGPLGPARDTESDQDTIVEQAEHEHEQIGHWRRLADDYEAGESSPEAQTLPQRPMYSMIIAH